ncbi:MAG: metal-dependent hydrolase [Bergeyella zoohelcum]|nr:metal-dependent hydrolase [Bergeyella zoohelcum]
MTIQFLGQNCFLLTYKGKTILTDPFYNFQKEESGFDIKRQNIDYVLITHAHGDHTADVKEVLEQYPQATIIAQPEICGYFGHSQNIDLNIGGTTEIDGLKITMVTAAHTSSFPDGAYGGTPAGYIFRYDGKVIYFAGDTGVMVDMALLPKLFGVIDLAILPIGGHYTMCSEQASYVASELVKIKKVIGCHFDTFPPISINHDVAKQHFSDKNVELILPKLGQEFEF